MLPNGFSLGGPEGRRNHPLAASTDYAPMVYGNYTASLTVVQAIGRNDDTLFVNQSTPMIAFECILIPCIIDYNLSLVVNAPDFAKFGANIVTLR
jgi:hypothetical protein